MATRSRIAIALKDGSFESVYCHFDGYPEGVGKTLLEHWTELEKIDELIGLGNISILGEEIGDKHPFNAHNSSEQYSKMTLFYGRDREEKNIECWSDPSYQALVERSHNCGAEYLYVFQNDRWHIANLLLSASNLEVLSV